LYTIDGNHFVRISKSLSSGQLDTNIGTEGRILIPVDRMEDIFLHTAQDGSITIAAGNYNKSADPNSSLGVAIVIRLTPVGTLNSQFGSGGVLRIFEKISTIVDVLHHDALGTAVVFDNYGGPPAGIAISVFEATGNPLSSFGTNGTATSVIDGVWRSAEFDEQGRIVAAATNIYDFVPKNRLYKIGPSGSLVNSFGNRGALELPIEYNYEFDQIEVTLRRGVIAVMGTNSLTAAKLRLAAYDYAGRPLTELAPQGTRDYDLSPFGESVLDLQFADDGSLWLAAQERSEFDSLGKVLRLEGSQTSTISNWISFLDVNKDGNIFPSDALLVINHLNSLGSPVTPGTYPDVNADANITPQDALLVINYLNASRGNGEGEAQVKPDAKSEPELAQASQLFAFQFEIPDTSNYTAHKRRTQSFARS
jgi:Dockerin type I domain